MKPLATLSLDLDDKWSYLKTRGVSSWQALPSYLGSVVPLVMKFLKERDLTISVFVVGQDAALPRNRELLASIASAGHEIGNHSFHHEPWLHLYTESELETELSRAEESIVAATGRRPVGFRGPGFTLSPATLQVLARRGYRYDASTLPTFIGPLARAYYFFTSSLSPEERAQRGALYGSLRDGLRPVKPYVWEVDGRELLEVPVTTMPFLKVPFHVSYVLYLSTFSEAFALSYFRWALRICEWTGTSPSLLLHPLDFLGGEDDSELGFFPAMGLPRERKLRLVDRVLAQLCERFEVRTLEEHVGSLAGRRDLRRVASVF